MSRDCLFCNQWALQPNVVCETANFRLVCDAFPLTEGHVLIIPKAHSPCFAALPPTLDGEFLTLREDIHRFLAGHYDPPVFFEHGRIGQTVGHAHLHALPTRLSILPLLHARPGFMEIHGPADLRRYYRAYGRYFFYAEDGYGYAMAPHAARPGELHLLFAEALRLPPEARSDKARGRELNRRVIEAWAEAHGRSGGDRARGD